MNAIKYNIKEVSLLMSNIQEIIAAKILANDKKIEEKFQASNFVLNTDIAELMRENEELQLQCPPPRKMCMSSKFAARRVSVPYACYEHFCKLR